MRNPTAAKSFLPPPSRRILGPTLTVAVVVGIATAVFCCRTYHPWSMSVLTGATARAELKQAAGDEHAAPRRFSAQKSLPPLRRATPTLGLAKVAR